MATTGPRREVERDWTHPDAGRHYAQSRFKNARARERDPSLVSRILARHAGSRRFGRALDVPCGAGRLHETIAQWADDYVGVDVSASMLCEAQSQAAGRLVRASVVELPFESEAFDLVVACRLLHHAPARVDLERWVGELARVSRRLILASFWDAASLPAWRRRLGLRERSDVRASIGKAELESLFAACGAPIIGYAHSFRFVSQQTFLVASKTALARTPKVISSEVLTSTYEAPGAEELLAEPERPVRAGWKLSIGRDAWVEPAFEAIGELSEKHGRWIEHGGERAYLKAGPLRGSGSWRHGLRRLLPGRDVPRLQEFANLSWMKKRLFRVPEPLVAGARFRLGMPIYQFLLTREVEGARTLLEVLEQDQDRAVRHELLEELAREVGRLHSLHFLHHDLYPRNVLVTDSQQGRLVFLDAWAGGLSPQTRPAAYDLGCFFLRGAELLDESEQRLFLHRYLEERRRQDRPVREARFLERVARERTRLARKLAHRPPAEWRAKTPPKPEWHAPS